MLLVPLQVSHTQPTNLQLIVNLITARQYTCCVHLHLPMCYCSASRFSLCCIYTFSNIAAFIKPLRLHCTALSYFQPCSYIPHTTPIAAFSTIHHTSTLPINHLSASPSLPWSCSPTSFNSCVLACHPFLLLLVLVSILSFISRWPHVWVCISVTGAQLEGV